MARIVFKLEDGTEIETELDSDVVSIGRHGESTVVLPSASVSSHHATIKHRGDAYYVQDLGTTNGTKVNGVEIEEAKLEDGDRLSFGDVPAVVHLSDRPVKQAAAATENPAPPKDSPRPGAWRMPRARRGTGTVTYQQSSGCAGFGILLLLLTLSLIAGMFVRHYHDHGGFLLNDLIYKLSDKSSATDSQAPATEKPSDAKPGTGKNQK